MGTNYDVKCPVFIEDGTMYVTSPYGERIRPETTTKQFHKGIDIVRRNVINTTATICAFDDGTVTATKTTVQGKDKSSANQAGNYVVIQHRNCFVSKYYHLKYGTIAVKKGETVKAGQKIGYMGTTGYSTGNHLHFQLELNGNHTNPLPYLLGEKTFDEGENDVILNVLKKGSKGAEVKALQILLVGNGYSVGTSGADGKFGAAVESALKKYQAAKKLTVDGCCGPATWTSLLKG